MEKRRGEGKEEREIFHLRVFETRGLLRAATRGLLSLRTGVCSGE